MKAQTSWSNLAIHAFFYTWCLLWFISIVVWLEPSTDDMGLLRHVALVTRLLLGDRSSLLRYRSRLL
jgi:hypothetical protein